MPSRLPATAWNFAVEPSKERPVNPTIGEFQPRITQPLSNKSDWLSRPLLIPFLLASATSQEPPPMPPAIFHTFPPSMLCDRSVRSCRSSPASNPIPVRMFIPARPSVDVFSKLILRDVAERSSNSTDAWQVAQPFAVPSYNQD